MGWLEALRKTYGYEPVVLTSSPPTRELENGLLLCRVRSWLTGNRMVSLPFSDHCAILCNSEGELEGFIRDLLSKLFSNEWKYLEFRPSHECFRSSAQKLGFKPVASYILHSIDLRPKSEDIFARLHKDSIQRRVRHAERAGVIEVCGRSQDILRDFFRLVVRTRARHNLPPQPYEWFENLLHCMGDAADLRLAYSENVPVAGVLILHFKGTSYYKYGASDRRLHRLGAMPFLLWRTILHAKSIGSISLNLGRTGKEEHGLMRFKNRFTSTSQPLTYWVFRPKWPLTFSDDRKLTMVKRLCALLPERLLATAGGVIYRHVG
jgi:Acetyltransferase (GNAT) domain